MISRSMGERRKFWDREMGQRGAARRREIGLSIGGLAKRLDCPTQKIYTLELAGASTVRLIREWAAALEMHPGDLAFGPPAEKASGSQPAPVQTASSVTHDDCANANEWRAQLPTGVAQ